ncbi:hypothetical protein Tco_1377358 [Tanacetum coccineum]
MTKPTSENINRTTYEPDSGTRKLNMETTIEIGDEFVKILQDNAFNRIDGDNVVNHIAKVLEILEWIKIPNVDKYQLRLHVFPISLSGCAKEWWDDEIKGTVTTWNELSEKFALNIIHCPVLAIVKSQTTWTMGQVILNF